MFWMPTAARGTMLRNRIVVNRSVSRPCLSRHVLNVAYGPNINELHPSITRLSRCGTDIGLAVDLAVMTGNEFGVVGPQELRPDREHGITVDFGDAGLLEEFECVPAGADEYETGADRERASVGADGQSPPAVRTAVQPRHLVSGPHLGATFAHSPKQIPCQGAEINVGTGLVSGRSDGLENVVVIHHQWRPPGDHLGVLAVFHCREQW